MNEYLFSYGTLQKESVQKNLFGRILRGSGDILAGYEIKPIEITDESFLSKGEEKYQSTLMFTNNKKDRIKGTILEITKSELLLADQYEPANYKRIEVMLESGRHAWVYMAI